MAADHVPLSLAPAELLALRILAEALGCSRPEVLRRGLRIVWGLYRRGLLRRRPRWMVSGHNARSKKRRDKRQRTRGI